MSTASAVRTRIEEDVVPDEAFVDLEAGDFSFWPARVWRFRHSNPANPRVSLNWSFELPSGGFSTDSEHIVLLEGFKTVVWGMLTNDAYGKRLSIGTLGSMVGGIREAFRWFAWQGLGDFGEISAAEQERYLDVLPRLILARDEVYPGFAAEGYSYGYYSRPATAETHGTSEEEDEEEVPSTADQTQEDGGFSYCQVANRISVIYYIHAQRSLLAKRGLPVFAPAPFKGKTVGEVSAGLAEYVVNRIPALPQAVSLPLLTEVLRWIDDVGPQVARVHLEYQRARLKGSDSLAAAFTMLDELGFSNEQVAPLPWRERVEDQGEELADPVSSGYHRMRLAALMYRDACVLALQYLAGLRISEVCSPMVLKQKVDGLPSCLYKRVSPDGMMDLYFLKGVLVKSRRHPKSTEWVIGCAPSGSSRVPALVTALDQLHDLFSPFLSDDKEMPLFLHFANRFGLPKSAMSVVRAEGITLQRGARRYIRCFVDLSKLPDFDRFGNSLVRYRETRGQCIRTHQGRKTFADFCLKTRKSALSPLSFHFGHLTESVTYKGYYEPVQRLQDDLESMAHSATVDFFVSRSEGRVVFGNMADAVRRFFDEFELNSIEDVRLLRARVKEIVIAHDIRIFFSDYGNCFISVAPMESRCQSAAGGVSWMLKRPNYITRSVSMCGGCNCFVLDESHLPYWENRAETWREAAKDPRNRVAVGKYQQSVVILRLFERR